MDTIPDFPKVLALAYDAVTQHIGSLDQAVAYFRAGMEDPDFAAQARARLQQLSDLEARTGADRLHQRDYIGSVHLDFLRRYMPPA